jgi:hypothetical protein
MPMSESIKAIKQCNIAEGKRSRQGLVAFFVLLIVLVFSTSTFAVEPTMVIIKRTQ